MSLGRCCCAANRVKTTEVPKFSAVCHCDDCRRRSGSAFGWSAYFAEDQVELIGDSLGEYRPEIEAPQIRWFCKDCGTTLAWRMAKFPGLIGVAGGLFPAGSLPEPSMSNKSTSCVDWVTLPVGWRRFD